MPRHRAVTRQHGIDRQARQERANYFVHANHFSDESSNKKRDDHKLKFNGTTCQFLKYKLAETRQTKNDGCSKERQQDEQLCEVPKAQTAFIGTEDNSKHNESANICKNGCASCDSHCFIASNTKLGEDGKGNQGMGGES